VGAAPSSFARVDFPSVHRRFPPRMEAGEATRHRPRPQPGSYLTDGVHLYRVVRWQVSANGDAAQLEDCRTLEVRAYGVRELGRMGLTGVHPGTAPDR
jgi:hypothetical protein